jgi:hypothetical protein
VQIQSFKSFNIVHRIIYGSCNVSLFFQSNESLFKADCTFCEVSTKFQFIIESKGLYNLHLDLC